MKVCYRVAGVLLLGGLAWAAVSPAEESAAEARSAEDFSRSFRRVAKTAGPAVVNLSTARVLKRKPEFPGIPDLEDLPAPFRRFFPGQPLPEEFEARGQGSGVIVDAAKGIILTNHHVVDGVETVKVRLQDGRELEGKVVGGDPKTDIAVVRVEGGRLQAVPLGDSDRMEQGDWVVAIGAPFGLEQTMTAGIVSAKGRANVNVIHEAYAEQDFIQTDAAINPGNSGGPLLNLRGEVIGINTAIAGGTGGNLGVGFAVPSNLAKRVMGQLLEKGRVVRGWIGVGIQDLTPELSAQFDLPEGQKGVVIGSVLPGSPAEEGGLEAGDLVVGIGDGKVVDLKELRRRIAGSEVGTPLSLRVLRDGKERILTVQVGEQPGDDAEARSVDRPAGTSLGLTVQDLPEGGVGVARVAPGSPAAGKGIRPGSVIVSVNRRPVASAREFREALAKADPAKGVLLLVRDDGGSAWVVLRP